MSDTYDVFVAEGPEWEASEGRTVLAFHGEWIADLDEDGRLMGRPHYEIAQAAAKALGRSDHELDLRPTGYTVGQTNPLNWATESDCWSFNTNV